MRPGAAVLVAIVLLASAAPAAGLSGTGLHDSPADVAVSATAGVAGSTTTDVTASTAADTDWTANEFELHSTLRLTPHTPGEITVTLRFAVPDRVDSLRTTLAPDARVVSTSGFAAGSGTNEFEWDGGTASPTVTYRLPANETAESVRFSGSGGTGTGTGSGTGTNARVDRSATAQADQYLFVDAGPWALVTTPSPSVHWRYTGDPLTLDRTVTAAGEGAVGERIAFLGEHRTHIRQANGQTFRLVVPAAAGLVEEPSAVLDALANASGTLRVGDRDQNVFFVAAPAGPEDLDWAVRGLQTGDADAWVRAGERLDTPDSPWLHEYVHTRQGFQPTRSSRWLVEGSADYYAALLALRQERIDFADFAADLARGARDPYADAVLAEPATWESGTGAGAQYLKGSLVTGELDRRIRTATNGSATFGSVLTRLNARGEPVTGETIRGAVADLGGESTADSAERYTRTRAVPEMWSRESHDVAFGTLPARITFTPPEEAVLEGPYRNGTWTPSLALVTGETLTLRTTAENVGAAAGEYELTLRVDGEPVTRRSGRLNPDERATVPLSHTFTEAGTHTLSVAGRTYRVRVREPATVSVGEVRTNRTTVAPNETVRVTAVARNDAAVPAAGDVPVVVDGERVGTRRVELAPNATRELSVTVRLSEPGEHRVSVGDRGVTVTVEDGAGDGAAVTTPGFGPVTAWVAVAVLSVVLRLASRRRSVGETAFAGDGGDGPSER